MRGRDHNYVMPPLGGDDEGLPGGLGGLRVNVCDPFRRRWAVTRSTSVRSPVRLTVPVVDGNLSTMRDLVLVHGGWGGAWCWEEVVPLLEEAGARVFTPTLAGLGERAAEGGAGIGMGTHVDDVVRVLDEHGLSDVVLVGHSYGGMPITGAAHRRPERVADLVYLDALVPEDGQSCADLLGPQFVEAARAAMARAGTPEQIPWLFTVEDILGESGPAAWRVAERMTPQPIGTLFERVPASGLKMRKSYIFCTGSIGLGLTAGFASKARDSTGWLYFELDSPHDALHAQPRAVADLLLSISLL
jgi:pimeloyl-ACP methyl ester carboxylesterase